MFVNERYWRLWVSVLVRDCLHQIETNDLPPPANKYRLFDGKMHFRIYTNRFQNSWSLFSLGFFKVKVQKCQVGAEVSE